MKQLLALDTPVFSTLCLDALSARVAEQAGFKSGYVSGGALGYAHAVSEALLSVDELADVVRHVTARSGLDIIVDGGVGFGDAVHLTRAIRQLESAGAAAIEIEDQVAPKRVSHHRGIEHLISMEEMVKKVSCAVDAKRHDATSIIARTGAVKNESFDVACERANAYAAAGADMILIMPETPDQWQQIASRIDAPIACFGALAGRSSAAWHRLGVFLVIDPFTVQVTQVRALQQLYRDFFSSTSPALAVADLFETYNKLDEIAGFQELYAIEDETTERPV
jgi:methylisocitrate lyase